MSFALSEKDMDFAKWKVADLKKELKNRGLSVEGKKNELVERLQLAIGDAALLDDTATDHDDILDEDVLTDEEALEDSELKSETPEKKEEKDSPVVGLKRSAAASGNNIANKQAKKITLNRNLVTVDKEANKTEGKENKEEKEESETTDKPSVVKVTALTEKERLEKRAAKFGVTMSTDAKKEARAARFGLPSADSKIGGLVTTNIDVLKKRAERFGTTLPGSALEKVELEERRKKREERFGKAEITADSKPVTKTVVTSATVDEKKRLRAERFKIAL